MCTQGHAYTVHMHIQAQTHLHQSDYIQINE